MSVRSSATITLALLLMSRFGGDTESDAYLEGIWSMRVRGARDSVLRS
jgi:hypothetical protein